MRLIDVSHTIEARMVTYKGLPAPIICDYLSREASRRVFAAGTEFQIGRIDRVAHTGTYVDSPFHRYSNGKDLSELPLKSLANLDCMVARIEPKTLRAIDELPFKAKDARSKAVLMLAAWDRHWRTEQYFEGFPHLTADLARWLKGAGVALSESTLTISIAPTRASARCIPSCWLRIFRSWSICAGWMHCQ